MSQCPSCLKEARQSAEAFIFQTRLAPIGSSRSCAPDAIKVKVSKGNVTLTGQVDHYFQQQPAEQDVRRLSGVVSDLAA